MKKFVKNNPIPIPVILGGFVNGLGLIRSFGYKKIPTILLDRKKTFSFYSKYTTGYICPDPEHEEQAFIEYLLKLGRGLPKKGVLFATNDIWLIPISKHRNELSQFFYFPMAEWDVIEKCWNKKFLYPIAESNGIPIPKTFFLDSIGELDSVADQMTYPCILKPSITIGFLEKLKANGRALVINDKNELIFWKERIIQADLGKVPLILQEQIEGPPSGLFTITSYANKSSDIVAYSIGHKIRQYPPDAGTITSGRLHDDPQIYELGKKLIKSLNYYGISNIEFKKDEKKNDYKLIEINPRPGMWNYSALMSGINLPYLAYCDLLQKDECSQDSTLVKNGTWIFLPSDFLYALYWNRRKGYHEYSLTLKQWFNSLKGRKIFAVESIDDPLPGLIHWIQFAKNSVMAAFLKKSERESDMR